VNGVGGLRVRVIELRAKARSDKTAAQRRAMLIEGSLDQIARRFITPDMVQRWFGTSSAQPHNSVRSESIIPAVSTGIGMRWALS